jgi:hypothetical protein
LLLPKVNPEILRWARDTAGLSPEEATQKLKIGDARGETAVDRLLALEAGEIEPTRPMIVKMAKQPSSAPNILHVGTTS